MRLDELMRDVPGVRIMGDPSLEVSAVRYDSRRVAPGDLFAAIPGERLDGAAFIKEAADRGARAFLVPRGTAGGQDGTYVQADNVREALALASRNYYGDPSARIKVVGVTGTNGKTTTSYLVHGVLENAGVKSGLVGTVQYLVGGQVISAARTTPESPDLLGLMDTMIHSGCEACIVEVSSHALTLHRVAGVRFEVAVFMNLTTDHLDFHRDMEDYFRAKSSLFESGEVRHKVVNRDDPYGSRLLDYLGDDAITFGIGSGDVRPEGPVRSGESGTVCLLRTPWGPVKVNTPLPGTFNLYNVMAAVACCALLGLDAEQIGSGLTGVGRVPGRFEKVDRGQPFTAVVDYAHTPDALKNVLENARAMTHGRLLLVFGCGGDRDRSKRPVMGSEAARHSDMVFVTSDNPRSEDPETILDDIMSGIKEHGAKVVRVADRRTAIGMAVAEAKPGDLLLVAGKGHENYQIVGDRVLPFSDVDELSRAIDSTRGEEL